MKADLHVEMLGLSLRNPFMVASGVLGVSSKLLARAYEAGAGAIVSKSIGLEEREGYTGPNIVVDKCWVINAMGLPNPGVEQALQELIEARNMGVQLIVSVYGFSVQEYVEVSRKVEEAGFNVVELNLSCPNVKGTGEEFGHNPETLSEVVASVKNRFKGHVIVKLPPDAGVIEKLGKAAEEAGADAVTAVNTIKGMAIDVKARRPVLSSAIGGVSGPALKPIALRCVYELHRRLKIPVIGCGGVQSWRDAVEFFLAGATAVQIGTALMNRDFKIFHQLESGIKKYMKSNGFKSVAELVGLASKT
ncbi:MAG: dihydroorotate dehydrogenase [Candidatus Bathyarchaeia archaeon]